VEVELQELIVFKLTNGLTASSGGSGVVILRMPTAVIQEQLQVSQRTNVDGSDTILVFNASGSYTA
jgi:hypothetical protein